MRMSPTKKLSGKYFSSSAGKSTRETAGLSFSLIWRSGAVVARRAHNPKVVGSNPTSRNYKQINIDCIILSYQF